MAAAAPPPENDWPARAADTVERVVETIRSKTTVPAINLARGLVYGLLAAFAVVTAIVLFCIVLIRIADIILPGGVWSAYLVVGLLFVLAGLLAWRQRKAPPEPEV